MYIKEIAYNFLIRYRITNLNFNVQLLNELSILNNWKLCKYSSNQKLIHNLHLEEHLKLDAFTFIKDNQIFILYNDDLPENDILFNILHEFGHILLDHSSSNNILGYSLLSETLIRQETEANTFACEVLAPSCVLKQLNINSIDDILKFSNLPAKHSIYHINNITNFSNIDDISERLIKIFNEYITKNTYNKEEIKIKPKRYIPLMLSISSILIITIFILFSSLKENNNIPNNEPIKNEIINKSTTSNVDNNKVFYITKTGSKYHIKDCRYIKYKNNLIELKYNDNLLKDYEPCSVCIK